MKYFKRHGVTVSIPKTGIEWISWVTIPLTITVISFVIVAIMFLSQISK